MAGFKDIIGRNELVQYMENAISSNQVSHAYILNGSKGAGKKYFAALFSQALLCETEGADPCNQCHSCRQAESGNHPDIIRVTHEKPNTISVDDVREQINNTVEIKPYQGPYKIYIVDQADMMTVQAQNALLKTIEEPPAYVVIMLLTENAQALLPTITSRCVMLKLRNVKDALVKKYLMDVLDVPEFKADTCAAFAQGNLGRAIMLANSEYFNEIRGEAVHLLKNIHEMELQEVVKAVGGITKYKIDINDYLDMIMIWYRDVLLYKATKEVGKVVFKDQMSSIKEQAEKSSYEGVEAILKGLEKAKERLKANVNFELTMELLFLTIKEN